MKPRFLLPLLLGLTLPARLALAAATLESELDARLSAADMHGLVALMKQHMTATDETRVITWLKAKVDAGAAPDRFAMTLALYDFHQGDLAGGLVYLNYERTLIYIDSTTCPDTAAGGALLQSTLMPFARMTEAAAAAQKTSAIDQATALEQKTASARKLDPVLCSAGAKLAAKQAGPAAKPKLPASESVPKAPLASDPAWVKKRAAALPKLKETLLVLNGLWTPKSAPGAAGTPKSAP